MSSSLSGQLLTAFETQRSRGESLLRRYYEEKITEEDLDDFHLVVRNRFLLGVHTAFLEATLQALTKKLRTKQRVAEALGLKHRTSIPKMIKSGMIDGVRLTAALNEFREIIKLPSKEISALYGFSRATSFIKAWLFNNTGIEGTMTPQEFSYLVGVLASPEWDAAIRSSEVNTIRALAVQIISERFIEIVPVVKRKARPEQCVHMLKELRMRWGDFAVIALWAIPDCIPEDESGEATS